MGHTGDRKFKENAIHTEKTKLNELRREEQREELKEEHKESFKEEHKFGGEAFDHHKH
ncbi:hypothetical protein [uncultured Clostridium sp.]|jgi:hypothetical protein|uniref:hypothetical protein n=1 Tax=uncultured Clostridium sp. TaxID=59620 RepID=UPI00261A716A|nr:hypothetical protein [uncultured Clostridium sp.]